MNGSDRDDGKLGEDVDISAISVIKNWKNYRVVNAFDFMLKLMN